MIFRNVPDDESVHRRHRIVSLGPRAVEFSFDEVRQTHYLFDRAFLPFSAFCHVKSPRKYVLYLTLSHLLYTRARRRSIA